MIFGQPTHTLGSSALRLGWMVLTHTQNSSKTGKCSGSTCAASTVLALTCPVDVSIQGSSRANPPICTNYDTLYKNFPNHGTNSVSVVSNWNWHPLIWVEGLAASHDLLTEFFSSSGWPISSVLIAACSLPNLIINHSCMDILFAKKNKSSLCIRYFCWGIY